MKIAVLGAGAWGTALAISLCSRHGVTLWTRDAAQCADMQTTRRNRRYLPECELPQALEIATDFAAVLNAADLAIVVVPISAFRQILQSVRASRSSLPVVWACKGFETGSAQLPHEIARQELAPDAPCGVLSGPSFALEVARGLPTALTFASGDPNFGPATAAQLHSPRLRLYSSDDVVGVEIAGAVKNVMAIAAGICDGLELGNNARAALITRGLAEISRLGLKLGGRADTFMGLAGAGDLILTCTGDLSRNRRVGMLLAEGWPLAEILNRLGHVAEGVPTAREALRLAEQHQVDMPITRAVCQVLHQGVAPANAVEALLNRDPKAES